MKALLVDYGGVLTTNVFDSFRAFCVDEGLDRDVIKRVFRDDPGALAAVRALEKGELSEDDFGERFGKLLELEPSRRPGLVERMFGHIRPDEAMLCGTAARACAGHPDGPRLELDGRRAL